MADYPPDVMPSYAQGYSVTNYLIQQGGKQKFVQFLHDFFDSADNNLLQKSLHTDNPQLNQKYLQDYFNSGNWNQAIQKNYGYKDTNDLQNKWNDWVRKGFPDLTQK